MARRPHCGRRAEPVPMSDHACWCTELPRQAWSATAPQGWVIAAWVLSNSSQLPERERPPATNLMFDQARRLGSGCRNLPVTSWSHSYSDFPVLRRPLTSGIGFDRTCRAVITKINKPKDHRALGAVNYAFTGAPRTSVHSARTGCAVVHSLRSRPDDRQPTSPD